MYVRRLLRLPVGVQVQYESSGFEGYCQVTGENVFVNNRIEKIKTISLKNQTYHSFAAHSHRNDQVLVKLIDDS